MPGGLTTTPVAWRAAGAGLFWSIAGLAVLVAAEILAVLVVSVVRSLESGATHGPDDIRAVFYSGDAIGLAFPLALPLLALVLGVVARKRRRTSLSAYVAMRPLSLARLAPYLAALVLVFGLYELSARFVDLSESVDFWLNAFATAHWPLLLLLTFVLFAPLTEELLFRGFVLQCWLDARLPAPLAVVGTALLWAVAHIQYGLFDVAWIVVLGVLLGAARVGTGSLLAPLLLHALWNLVGYLQIRMYPSG